MTKRGKRKKSARRQHHQYQQHRINDAHHEGSNAYHMGKSPRIRPLLDLMREIAMAADEAARMTSMQDRQLVTFDLAVIIRGINALKASRLLLEEAFWEAASSQARQLFELVINMEHLDSLPDRQATTLLYARFGMLQRLQAERRSMQYDASSGRPVSAERVAFVNELLTSCFHDFEGRCHTVSTSGGRRMMVGS